MRHRVRTNTLSRASDQRKAMTKHLVRSLFEHGKVETTVLRAKQARSVAERLITYGKRAQFGMQVGSVAQNMMAAARDSKDKGATLKAADALVDILEAAITRLPEGSARANRAAQAKADAQQVIELANNNQLEEAVPVVRRIWLYGSGQNVSLRRQARKLLGSSLLVSRVFEELAPEYADRPGGYTRVTRTGLRRGDAAQKAVLELVD